MPLSSNAPFNEFGQSMILRDIEQLYLSISPGGDGGNQGGELGVSQDTLESEVFVEGSGSGDPTIVDGAVTTVKIADAAVTKAKIEDSAGVSVIGRAANTTGVTADITASADNYVLGRRSGMLTWAKISTNELNDASVTKAKIENSSGCSVVGRSANSTGVVADILASDGTLLTRSQGSNTVSFSNNPIIVRDSQNLSVCMVATITTSTTTPTRTGSKGELYIIY